MTAMWNSVRGRVLLSVLAGLLVGILVGALATPPIESPSDDPRRDVLLVIPSGTAERVAIGEAPPTIPEGMQLTSGDTLVVRNEDVASHELGPVWVPAGATGRLTVRQSSRGFVTCSFRPEGYFGLEVVPRFSWVGRLYVVLATGFPFAVLFGAFSLAMAPLTKGASKSRNLSSQTSDSADLAASGRRADG
jgi:hypothetical protein